MACLDGIYLMTEERDICGFLIIISMQDNPHFKTETRMCIVKLWPPLAKDLNYFGHLNLLLGPGDRQGESGP